MNFFIHPSGDMIETHLAPSKLGWQAYPLFHARMGHINDDTLLPIFRAVTGLKGSPPIGKCVDCSIAKAKKVSLPKAARHTASRPLEHVHADVVGPLRG